LLYKHKKEAMISKLLIFSILLIFPLFHSFSQTNDRIKEESDKNREERNRRSGSRGSSSSSDDSNFDTEGCLNGCSAMVDGCSMLANLAGAIYKGLDNANYNIKLREDSIPRIHSIELGANIGYVDPNSTLIMPSIRIRGGLLSTYFRVFSNIERHIDGKNSYTNVNWQILQFNLAVSKNFNLNIGTGILLETYSSQIFQEFGVGTEIFPGKFYFPIEFRFTPDYSTGKTVLTELHTGIGYNLMYWTNCMLRFQANYTTAKYYESVNLNAFSAGFILVIDTGKSRIEKIGKGKYY
jgi:hypothetical protein